MFTALHHLARPDRGRGLSVLLIGDETVLARINASLASNGMLMVGGDLVITSRRVVFGPRHPDDAGARRTWTLPCPAAGDPAGAKPTALVTVRAGARGRVGCPPTLIITDVTGRSVEFAVLGHVWSPNTSARNAAARDRVVGLIANATG